MAIAIPTPRRFTVEEYYRMGRAGILGPEERVELLDGEIIKMSPIGPRHAYIVDSASRTFFRRVGDAAVVRIQNPVRLGPRSEPVPDLSLLRPRPRGYAEAHPMPEDVFLVLEVADTSVAYDRRRKMPAYARAGVPEAWLLVLGRGRRRSARTGIETPGEPTLEVNRGPGPDGYRETRLVRRGERISPEALPGVEIALEDLLGE
jgi:Uma2 family endonuclease